MHCFLNGYSRHAVGGKQNRMTNNVRLFSIRMQGLFTLCLRCECPRR
jgi:hypothetical protein